MSQNQTNNSQYSYSKDQLRSLNIDETNNIPDNQPILETQNPTKSFADQLKNFRNTIVDKYTKNKKTLQRLVLATITALSLNSCVVTNPETSKIPNTQTTIKTESVQSKDNKQETKKPKSQATATKAESKYAPTKVVESYTDGDQIIKGRFVKLQDGSILDMIGKVVIKDRIFNADGSANYSTKDGSVTRVHPAKRFMVKAGKLTQIIKPNMKPNFGPNTVFKTIDNKILNISNLPIKATPNGLYKIQKSSKRPGEIFHGREEMFYDITNPSRTKVYEIKLGRKVMVKDGILTTFPDLVHTYTQNPETKEIIKNYKAPESIQSSTGETIKVESRSPFTAVPELQLLVDKDNNKVGFWNTKVGKFAFIPDNVFVSYKDGYPLFISHPQTKKVITREEATKKSTFNYKPYIWKTKIDGEREYFNISDWYKQNNTPNDNKILDFLKWTQHYGWDLKGLEDLHIQLNTQKYIVRNRPYAGDAQIQKYDYTKPENPFDNPNPEILKSYTGIWIGEYRGQNVELRLAKDGPSYYGKKLNGFARFESTKQALDISNKKIQQVQDFWGQSKIIINDKPEQ